MKDNKKQNKVTEKEANSPKGAEALMEEYFDLSFMKRRPINQAFIDRLALDYYTFFEKNKSRVHKYAFFIKKRIPRNTFYTWIDKHPIMQEADDFVEMILFERLHQGATTKKYNENIARMSMSEYNKKWESREEWKANLQAKTEQNPTTINIVRNYDEEDNTGSKR